MNFLCSLKLELGSREIACKLTSFLSLSSMTGQTEIVLILQLMLDLSKVAFEPHVLPSTSCVYAQSRVNTYGSLSIKGGGGTPF